MKGVPDNWKQKYNSDEYAEAHARLMRDIVEQPKRPDNNTFLGWAVLAIIGTALLVGMWCLLYLF